MTSESQWHLTSLVSNLDQSAVFESVFIAELLRYLKSFMKNKVGVCSGPDGMSVRPTSKYTLI